MTNRGPSEAISTDRYRLRIEQSDAARDKYLDFVVRRLQDGPAVDVKSLARILVDGDPDRTLKDAYVNELTGSSLQSTEQVTTTLTALDLNDERHLYVEAKSLRPLFQARNQIAHELDMTSGAIRGRGRRSRHERSIQAYTDMCHQALNYSQRFLNTVSSALESE